MEKNNYGASEPISLAVIGAKIGAIFGKKALAAGGKSLIKGGGKIAKKKGAKVLSEKAMKRASKKVVRQGVRKQSIDKLKYKGDVLGMKAKNFAQNYKNDNLTSVKKLAEKTGNSYEDTMDMVKSGVTKVGAIGATAVKSRQGNETTADPSSFVSSADKKITEETGKPEVASSGYANPQGPSAYFNKNAGPSMRKGLKYDNCGASMPLQAKSNTTSGDLKTNKPILSSLDKKNIMTKQGASANLSSLSSSNIKTRRKANAFDYLKGFDANVNIKGFKVNIGQAAQIAGLLGKGAVLTGKKFGDYTKKRKVLKNTKASSTTPKNIPASQASKQQKFSNIAQNNPTTYNYLTRGIKPGGKVTGKDASIFKQNK